MATTAAAQTKEHEKYSINLPGEGKGENDKTHAVQIDTFTLTPPAQGVCHTHRIYMLPSGVFLLPPPSVCQQIDI